jgi:hypothetical protein
VLATGATWKNAATVLASSELSQWSVYGKVEINWGWRMAGGYYEIYDYVSWLTSLTVTANDFQDFSRMTMQLSAAHELIEVSAAFPGESKYTMNFSYTTAESASIP